MNVFRKHPTRHRALGLVQMAVLRHIETSPERAYGLGIADDVSKLVKRDFADAQIYIALRRLEDHGMISSRLNEIPVLPKTRGRPRKYYFLTAMGKDALEEMGAYTTLSPRTSPRGANGKENPRPLTPAVVG